MSDIGYILLLRAILRRAELDAESNDARLRYEALAFLVEYGLPLCKLLEQYLPSMHETRKKIIRWKNSVFSDAQFVMAANKRFVQNAVARYGAKTLSIISGISRAKLLKADLSDEELRHLHGIVAELDDRVIRHANELALVLGLEPSAKDPWTAMALITSLRNGTFQFSSRKI